MPQPNITELMRALSASTPSLNAICNQAAEKVKVIETFLASCHIGMQAVYHIESTKLDAYFAYTKIGGNFRLALKANPVTGTEPFVAWSDLPRDLKLSCLPFLPNLLQELVNKVDEATRAAVRGLIVLDNVMRELGIPTEAK